MRATLIKFEALIQERIGIMQEKPYRLLRGHSNGMNIKCKIQGDEHKGFLL